MGAMRKPSSRAMTHDVAPVRYAAMGSDGGMGVREVDRLAASITTSLAIPPAALLNVQISCALGRNALTLEPFGVVKSPAVMKIGSLPSVGIRHNEYPDT